MTANIGQADRIVRAALGLLLLILPFATDIALFASPLATALSVLVGAVLLGTAALRVCPAYTLLGVRTCRRA